MSRGTEPPAGPRWLRVVCAEAGTEGGTLRDGPSASRTLPASVPRPELLRIRDWTTGAYAYRAELYAFVPDPMISPRPVLDEDPGLPETWWKEMTAALDALADVPPPADREAVREEYLRRVIPSSPATRSTTSPGPPPTATSTRATSPAARTSWTGKDGAAPRTDATRPPCTCTHCSPPKRPPASGPSSPPSWTGPRHALDC